MELHPVTHRHLAAVHALLVANGWAGRIGDLREFAALVDASQVAVVAVVDGEVAGFARAITDGLSNGYLSMLVVAEPHRRQGIGRALVEHVLGTGPCVTWVLRAGRDGAPAFFARLGFEPSTVAMERRRADG
jgi:GNAT superfamily N-acetyltransferase